MGRERLTEPQSAGFPSGCWKTWMNIFCFFGLKSCINLLELLQLKSCIVKEENSRNLNLL